MINLIPVSPASVAALELQWVKGLFSAELQKSLAIYVVELRREVTSNELALVVSIPSEAARQTVEMDLLVKKLRAEIKSNSQLKDRIYHLVVASPARQVPVYARGRF